MMKCDIFLLTSFKTSNQDKEGTPVVIMEAQACGKPCIATNHAGIPEQVLDGKNGILVEEKNIYQIKEAMDLLADNHKMRIRMGKNARNHVINNFNSKKQIIKLNHIYNKLTT